VPSPRKTEPPTIEAVRAFNRFYTRKLGLLQQGLLDSSYSLTEVRILYELGHRQDLTATDLIELLGIDPGYLSRLLRNFAKGGLVGRRRSSGDGRRTLLRLTARGRRVFSDLDERQSAAIARLLGDVPPVAHESLVASLKNVERVLSPDKKGGELNLRAPRAGDMGWVMSLHGDLYYREYGWDHRFEALVGEIIVSFMRSFDSARERAWIAELDGERVGSIFLVRDTDTVAKLRLLLVSPGARGLGVGKRLVDECIAFARQAEYRKLTLWTQSVLAAARHIYERQGFQLVKEETHDTFGSEVTGQYWELAL
jgi:DNA-binding MarR family transcriptional regulator/GNAT superfamily N-acetyltransferase